MRVAVLASGFMYNAFATAESLQQKLIEPNGADVFLVTSRENYLRRRGGVKAPRTDTAIEVPWPLMGMKLTEDSDYQDDLRRQLALYEDRLLRTFRPRFKPEYVADAYRMATIDQYLRLKWCWLLMRKHEALLGFRYDVVVRCRPDLAFDVLVDVRTADDALHVPCKELFYHHHHDRNYLKEFFFWARAEVFDRVAGFVDSYGAHLDPLFELGGADYTLAPEYQFYLFAKYLGLDVQFEPYTCNPSSQADVFAYRVVRTQPDAEGADAPSLVQLRE